ARLNVRFVHNAPDAACVIDVGVRINYGFPGSVLVVKIERRARGFRRYQGIVDRDALVPLDDGHVRQVRPAPLVDAWNHLIEASVHQELRYAPETRIDGVRRRRLIFDETGES